MLINILYGIQLSLVYFVLGWSMVFILRELDFISLGNSNREVAVQFWVVVFWWAIAIVLFPKLLYVCVKAITKTVTNISSGTKEIVLSKVPKVQQYDTQELPSAYARELK